MVAVLVSIPETSTEMLEWRSRTAIKANDNQVVGAGNSNFKHEKHKSLATHCQIKTFFGRY